MRPIRRFRPLMILIVCAVVLGGCSSAQIRVENVSTRNFTNLSIAGQAYGDLEPGESSDYKSVRLRFRYAALKLHADGRYITGQTLNFGASRYTYRIGVRDFDTRQLAIEMIREK